MMAAARLLLLLTDWPLANTSDRPLKPLQVRWVADWKKQLIFSRVRPYQALTCCHRVSDSEWDRTYLGWKKTPVVQDERVMPAARSSSTTFK